MVNLQRGNTAVSAKNAISERRRIAREATPLRLARINLNGGIDCKVSNLSDSKATLEIPQSLDLPIEFYIEIEGESTNRYCATAWRRKQRMLVYFV